MNSIFSAFQSKQALPRSKAFYKFYNLKMALRVTLQIGTSDALRNGIVSSCIDPNHSFSMGGTYI